MIRSHADNFGFSRLAAPVASPGLLRAVAASLVFAACLSVALTVLSIRVSMAMSALS